MGADQGAFGLTVFKNMVSAWALDGIRGLPPDLALDDNFPFAQSSREGVTYLLAGRLSPAYSAPVGFDPDGFFRKIQANAVTVSPVVLSPIFVRRFWP